MSESENDISIDSSLCSACKSNEPDPSYSFPLCPDCRILLANRPFPKWIKVVMVFIGVLMLFSTFKFPIAYKAGLAEQAAKQAENTANFSKAVSGYQKVLALFPESEEHKARLAICYINTGEYQQAFTIIDSLNDKKLSQDVIAELNALIEELKQGS